MKSKEDIQDFINNLIENKFQKTTDKCFCYSKNADLYYHEISFENYQLLAQQSIYLDQDIYKQDDRKYFIVINHFNKTGKPEIQGFDLWLSVFNSSFEIGNRDCVHNYSIQLSCDAFKERTTSFFKQFNQICSNR